MIEIIFDGTIEIQTREKDGTVGRFPVPEPLVKDMLQEWADTTLWRILRNYADATLEIKKSPPKRKAKKSTRERK